MMMDLISRLLGRNPGTPESNGSNTLGNSVKQFLGSHLRKKDNAAAIIADAKEVQPVSEQNVETRKASQLLPNMTPESSQITLAGDETAPHETAPHETAPHEKVPPFENILTELKTSTACPEQYVMGHPDFLLSLFKRYPSELLLAMAQRIEMLEWDIRTWVGGDRRAAEKQISDLYALLEAVDDTQPTEQTQERMKQLLQSLRQYEEQHGKTPYEDLCRGALLVNDGDQGELAAFFAQDNADESLLDQLNPERFSIHKSPRDTLKRLIDQHLNVYRQRCQEQALHALEQGLVLHNLGETRPEGLCTRLLTRADNQALAISWLSAGLAEGWILGSVSASERQGLCRQLADVHSARPEALVGWLAEHRTLQGSLQSGLAMAYAGRVIQHLETRLAEVGDHPQQIKGALAWCQDCQSLLADLKEPGSAGLLARLDTLRSGFLAHQTRLMYEQSPLARFLSYEDCQRLDGVKGALAELNQAGAALAALQTRAAGEVSIAAEVEAGSRFLTAQMELLFKYGEHLAASDDPDAGLQLEQLGQQIQTIDYQRAGPVALRNYGKNALARWRQVGAGVLQGNEEPVALRLRRLKLKHQLRLDGYNYYQERQDIFNRLYQAIVQLGIVGEETCEQLYRDRASPAKLLWHLLNVRDGASEQVRSVLQQAFFEDFQALMASQPRMARNMMGDIAQSAAITGQLFGERSALSRLFEQLDWRAAGETAQSFVNERFAEPYREYDHLNTREKEAIKRMYALCELLKEAPSALQTARAMANVGKHLAVGNFGYAAYEGVKGAAELWGVQKIQSRVGQMSDNEVRTLHMALSTLQHGPAETMVRMYAMRRSANILADTVKGHGLLRTGFLNSELMRPFVFRYNRLSQAIRAYHQGEGSGRELALEFGKVAMIAGGAVGALALTAATAGGAAVALGVGSAAWASVSLVTSFSVPTLLGALAAGSPLGIPFLQVAHGIARRLMQAENLEAPLAVLDSLFRELRDNPENQLSQLKEKLGQDMARQLQDNAWIREYQGPAIARATCQQVHDRHWAHFREAHPEQAEDILGHVDRLLGEDSQELTDQLQQVNQQLGDWQQLARFMQDMPADSALCRARLDALPLDVSTRQALSGDERGLPYRILMVLEMLQENLSQQLGVDMDWQDGTIRVMAQPGKESNQPQRLLTLDSPRAVRQRLQDYQMTLLLGDLLCRHYLKPGLALDKARQSAEQEVLARAQRLCAKQASGAVDRLLRQAIGQLVTQEQGEAGQVDREAARQRLSNNRSLQQALQVEEDAMKAAAEQCMKARFKLIRRQLEDLGIAADRKQLARFMTPGSGMDRRYSDQPRSDRD